MGSCKILLVTALLVGIASQQSSATRNLHGDHHVAEKKFGGGGGGYGGGGGGGYGGGGGGGGYSPSPTTGFTGSCDFWKSHPEKIISCIGSLGSIVGSFGDVCSGFFGSKLQTLQDALCSTRKDCYGDLLREGAAAYINSVAALFKKANLACHYT
ncbi:hypothetical protein DAI22_06g184500 [Oryza sativa Japonica Group]|nr:hypothetical protein DAI22_06g184500 [Oryza sativa Japonica Group]